MKKKKKSKRKLPHVHHWVFGADPTTEPDRVVMVRYCFKCYRMEVV